jgi:hypothetical protein
MGRTINKNWPTTTQESKKISYDNNLFDVFVDIKDHQLPIIASRRLRNYFDHFCQPQASKFFDLFVTVLFYQLFFNDRSSFRCTKSS